MAIKASTSVPALYSRSEDNLSSLMQMDDDADAQKVIMLDLPHSLLSLHMLEQWKVGDAAIQL